MNEVSVAAPPSLLRVARVFAVLGTTSFGGGVVAYLRDALVEREGWFDDQEFAPHPINPSRIVTVPTSAELFHHSADYSKNPGSTTPPAREGAMPETRTGGCQCGAVRYELAGEPLPLVICHCHECQKQTSSAFGMSLPVAKKDLRVSGTLKEWRRLADSGREVACWFCPECGTRLYHSSLLGPAYWHLKPGTLDDTDWLDPVAEVWVQSAQPWLHFSDRLLSFAREPDDIPAITARWQGRQK